MQNNASTATETQKPGKPNILACDVRSCALPWWFGGSFVSRSVELVHLHSRRWFQHTCHLMSTITFIIITCTSPHAFSFFFEPQMRRYAHRRPEKLHPTPAKNDEFRFRSHAALIARSRVDSNRTSSSSQTIFIRRRSLLRSHHFKRAATETFSFRTRPRFDVDQLRLVAQFSFWGERKSKHAISHQLEQSVTHFPHFNSRFRPVFTCTRARSDFSPTPQTEISHRMLIYILRQHLKKSRNCQTKREFCELGTKHWCTGNSKMAATIFLSSTVIWSNPRSCRLGDFSSWKFLQVTRTAQFSTKRRSERNE